jgi:hypothetical protein
MSVRSLKFLTKVLSLILLLNIESSFEKVSSCLYLLLQAAINPHSNALSGTNHLFDHFLRACSLIEIKDIVRTHKYAEQGEELITKMPALASEEKN